MTVMEQFIYKNLLKYVLSLNALKMYIMPKNIFERYSIGKACRLEDEYIVYGTLPQEEGTTDNSPG